MKKPEKGKSPQKGKVSRTSKTAPKAKASARSKTPAKAKHEQEGHDSKHGHHGMYQKMMQMSGAKGGYHRDQIFIEDKRSDYLWCLHCGRTYLRGEYRDVDGFQMCPYEGCDGSTVLDGIDWERFRDDYPKYPKIPERGKVYGM